MDIVQRRADDSPSMLSRGMVYQGRMRIVQQGSGYSIWRPAAMGVLEGVNNIRDVRGRIFGVHILAIRTCPFPLGAVRALAKACPLSGNKMTTCMNSR